MASYTIKIDSNGLAPSSTVVASGDKVTWFNAGNSAAEIEFTDGSFTATVASGESSSTYTVPSTVLAVEYEVVVGSGDSEQTFTGSIAPGESTSFTYTYNSTPQ